MAMFGRENGGSRVGSAPISSQQEQIDRRERLRLLALEKISLDKDPYFMRNHLGSFECKLCLTLHQNEGSYLAHTQGKRHQSNLARRAFKDAQNKGEMPPAPIVPTATVGGRKPMPRSTIKIGRPGYRVTKQRDPVSKLASLLFEIEYPEITLGSKPMFRFMSAFEQHVDPPDKRYQYILFAAEPYETIGFKVPNREIERQTPQAPVPGIAKQPTTRYLLSHWDPARKLFTLQVHFKPVETPSFR